MNREPIEDLKEIRRIMETSSRFLYVNGTSMVMTGLFALGGIAVHLWHYGMSIVTRSEGNNAYSRVPDDSAWTNKVWEYNLLTDRQFILSTALIVLSLTLVTVFLFSWREMRKSGERMLTPASRQLLLHFGVPLVMSGFICLRFLNEDEFFLLPGLSILLYGICLLSASKFTFSQMKFLALSQMVIGLIGLYFPESGVICWALGFGVAHIVFGLWMNFYFKR